jgi:ABC-type amino acid transport substrate-binding protein
MTRRFSRTAVAGILGILVAVAAVAATGAAAKSDQSGNPLNLRNPKTLTVGMSLQFKPQAYLDAKGRPAGYDVVLMRSLARQMKVRLDIKNLDFNGLIPGLVTKKFDIVTVGL